MIRNIFWAICVKKKFKTLAFILSNEQSVPVILWKEHENAIAELCSARQAVGKIPLNWDHNLTMTTMTMTSSSFQGF